MWASRIVEKAFVARMAMALALFSGPFRSLQSFSVTKAMPAFWPLPAGLKPTAVNTLLTFLASCLT